MLATVQLVDAQKNWNGRPLRSVAYKGSMQNTMVVKGKLSFQITPVCEISSIGTYIFFLIQKTKQRKVRLHNQSREHTASPSSTQRRHPTPDNKKNIKSQKKSTSCFASFGVSRVYILKGLLRREVEERGLFLFFLDLFERCPCAHVVTSPLDRSKHTRKERGSPFVFLPSFSLKGTSLSPAHN